MSTAKIKPIFQAEVKSGQLFFLDRKKFDGYVAGLKDDRYKVTISRYKKTRSDKQNRYYWGVVIKILCEETGDFSEDADLVMHEVLKAKFLSKIEREYINPKTGELLLEKVSGSTQLIDTSEMEGYLAKIRAWASMEMGINIPEPNEIDYSQVW